MRATTTEDRDMRMEPTNIGMMTPIGAMPAVGLGQGGSVGDTAADHRPSLWSRSTAHGIDTREMIPGKRRMPGTP